MRLSRTFGPEQLGEENVSNRPDLVGEAEGHGWGAWLKHFLS
jgi:hypothetical protein